MAVAATVAMTTAAAPATAELTERTQVNAWYQDFLGRDATADPGSQYWVDTIGRSKPADALWAITHSREYTETQVASYYNDYLDRAPDPGASDWVDGAVAGRFPVEWAQQNVLASQEFADRWSASSSREFVVRAWYLYVLNRTPGDGEVAYWAGRIDRAGRLAALREIWYSGEAVRYRVNQHYRDLLRRDADIPGLSYWYGKEVESDINVQVLLAATRSTARRASTSELETAEGIESFVQVGLADLAQFVNEGSLTDSFSLAAMSLAWRRGLLAPSPAAT